MADRDLEELLTAGSEALEVEYKAWMDTSHAESKAKLARHLAALSNHGGGYLVFGVDDRTRAPQGATPLPAKLFGEDAISSIVKRYLDPPFQCRVASVEHGGTTYPVVVVPPHGPRPVIAIADGPPDARKQPIGIREGAVYIRAPGPQSIAVRRPDDWGALLDRCLGHRADVLARIMRQAITKPGKPSTAATDLLKAASNVTADEFIDQMGRVAPLVEENDRAWVRHMADSFVVLGYALLDEDGELMTIHDLRRANSQANVGLHEYAYSGWSAFLPLHVPERAPQLRSASLLGRDRTFLEGMRPEHSSLLTAFDYWRVYEDGVSCSAEAYHEDRGWPREPIFDVGSCLARLHSVLAHGRLIGDQVPGTSKLLFFMDWRGISDRVLCLRGGRAVSPMKLRGPRFAKTIAVDWRELRDDYFEALRRVGVPFFDLFANEGSFDPHEWFTEEMVELEFRAIDQRMRLFDVG